VGCTSYYDPRYWPGRPDLCAVEIGWTWLAASAQGTGINTGAKLLLEHAFGSLRVARVDFKTDARNARSRRALAGLGRFLRGRTPGLVPVTGAGEEGRLRDSAMFSVPAAEWPAIRAGLCARIKPLPSS
jgi:N-acetyltransferase